MNVKLAIIIVAFILMAGGAYYFGQNYKVVSTVSTPTPTQPVVASPTPAVTSVPATPTPDDAATLKVVIAQQLTAQGHPGLTITVSKIEGNYASGMASAQGGGGMWFAAKVRGQWQLVWSGNGVILCKDLTNYPDFPKDMIPECYNDATGKTVTR